MSYTDEQLTYINYVEPKHTKLLACAGSGKTRCIIARIENLIKQKVYDADSILMLTFSRFTRDDFMNKIKSLKSIIDISSISTIDKFAKTIIDPNSTVDVSLLSFKLMKYLESTKKSVLKKNQSLSKIKIVFVDEAQDLNDIQYRIFCAMKDKLNIVINMVGDPNQNIYQFRDSSDKYLTEFDAEVFRLTKNFRSHLPIVDFSKHLRPFTEYDVICTKGDNNCKPVIILYENENKLETELIDILTMAKSRGIEMSDIAILSPTRGRMRGGGSSHGLCFVSNTLYKSNIKFKQFYEESVDDVSAEGIKYDPEPGHVNVLTYMGSKGLEWKYVIMIDADTCLINKRSFDDEKHKNDRYLLYVACSRAVDNMIIFSKCVYRQGNFQFNTNPWFKLVPENLYEIDSKFSDIFFFPKLQFRESIEKDDRVFKIIEKLNCYDLDNISNILNFQDRTVKNSYKFFTKDYTVDRSSIFLAKFTECFFRSIYNIKMKRPHLEFPEIETIIEGEHIVSGVSDEVSEFFFRNKKTMTWAKFDSLRDLDPLIKNTINFKFDRNTPFSNHIIALNGYYQMYILEQRTWIKNLYKKYLKCKNVAQIREIIFYLIVIKHSIDTQHYFHIKSKGEKYTHILTDFKDMFDELETYVEELDYNFVSSNVSVERWGLVSRIDLIDENNKLFYLRCSNEISLKHTLVSIVSYLMHTDTIDDNFNLVDKNNKTESKISIVINYINLMKGEEVSYIYNLNSFEIKTIIEILQNNISSAKVSDLVNPTTTNVNLVIKDVKKEMKKVTRRKLLKCTNK